MFSVVQVHRDGKTYPVAHYDEEMHFRGEARFLTKSEAAHYLERYRSIVKPKHDKKLKLKVLRV